MKKYLSLIIFSILTINLVAQDITISFKTSDTNAVIDSFQAISLATNLTFNYLSYYINGNWTQCLIVEKNTINNSVELRKISRDITYW
jgi:hypothetical protein